VYLFGHAGRLQQDAEGRGLLLLLVALMTHDAVPVDLPVTEVVGVALPERLQVVLHQDQAALNHQQIGFRILKTEMSSVTRQYKELNYDMK
jgi:hypothetical protein